MNLGTWTSMKSSMMDEIRTSLKKKPEKGQPTPSRKEANRTWREEVLGILSEEQKKQNKTKRQEKNKKIRIREVDEDEQ